MNTLPVVSADPTALTMEQFQAVLPKQIKASINQVLVDRINNTISDPIIREQYRDNILGFIHVMKEGKFKMDSYLDAVRYVGFKLMGDTNTAAYVKTFPNRYQSFLANGTSEKDIASYITSYNKNKLVNLIFEQTLIPNHVLNADMYQRALNVQVELMTTANSEKVRSDAANSILTHLKPPESKKIELDIGIKEDRSISDLRESILLLGAKQREMISSGVMTAKEVAHSSIVIEHSE
jgi:hypothetical protein